MGASNRLLPRLGFVQRMACRFGHHHRDGDNVRRSGKMWRSVCTGCGASMVKTEDGWVRRMDMPDAQKNASRAGDHGL